MGQTMNGHGGAEKQQAAGHETTHTGLAVRMWCPSCQARREAHLVEIPTETSYGRAVLHVFACTEPECLTIIQIAPVVALARQQGRRPGSPILYVPR